MPHIMRRIVEDFDVREADEADDQHAQHGGKRGAEDGVGPLYRIRMRGGLR
jgi:hypothetical protein